MYEELQPGNDLTPFSSEQLLGSAEAARAFRKEVHGEFIRRALDGDESSASILASASFGTSAIYPGSFDPFTNGHLDLVTRSARLFDEIVVAVGINPGKKPLFSAEERVMQITEATAHLPNVRTIAFDDGLAFRAEVERCGFIIRGVREVTDYADEMRLAQLNRNLSHLGVETVLFPADPNLSTVSSSVVKGLTKAFYGIREYVPESVARAMRDKIALNEISSHYHGCLSQFVRDKAKPLHESFDRLIEGYQDPERAHHNLWHLKEMFQALERSGPFRGDPAIELAIVGHDAVYDPARKDNETKSAELLDSVLTPFRGIIPPSILSEASRLIVLSAGHKPDKEDLRGQLFVNLDLAILASPRNRYQEYAADIRAEYTSHYSEEEYCVGRTHFLGTMLEKDQIFYPMPELALSEDVARSNLRWELEKLRSNEK